MSIETICRLLRFDHDGSRYENLSHALIETSLCWSFSCSFSICPNTLEYDLAQDTFVSSDLSHCTTWITKSCHQVSLVSRNVSFHFSDVLFHFATTLFQCRSWVLAIFLDWINLFRAVVVLTLAYTFNSCRSWADVCILLTYSCICARELLSWDISARCRLIVCSESHCKIVIISVDSTKRMSESSLTLTAGTGSLRGKWNLVCNALSMTLSLITSKNSDAWTLWLSSGR